MTFSTEAIVALAVAVVFALLSVGAIAREQGQASALGRQNTYIAANDVNVSYVGANNPDVLGFY